MTNLKFVPAADTYVYSGDHIWEENGLTIANYPCTSGSNGILDCFVQLDERGAKILVTDKRRDFELSPETLKALRATKKKYLHLFCDVNAQGVMSIKTITFIGKTETYLSEDEMLSVAAQVSDLLNRYGKVVKAS